MATRRRFCRRALVCGAIICSSSAVQAQRIRVPTELVDTATAARGMRTLALALLAQYKESDRARALDNQFRLQIAAEQYDDAARSIEACQRVRGTRQPARERNSSRYTAANHGAANTSNSESRSRIGASVGCAA